MAALKAVCLRFLAMACCCVLIWAIAPLVAGANGAPPPPEATPEAPPAETPPPPVEIPAPDPRPPAASPAPAATPAKAGRTYEQPPDPYNMEGMEVYDQEVYGEGR